MDVIQICALAILLVIAFLTDVKSQIIPNRLTLGFFLVGLLYQTAFHGLDGLLSAAVGAASGFVPLLLLYAARGIGAGDVKLFGAIGAWSGTWLVLQLLLYAILYAGLIGLLLVIVNRPYGKKLAGEASALLVPDAGWRRLQWMRWAQSGKKFPFMLAVAPAAITVLFMMN
ncbi:Type 4 prepilin-like proteins leader peptide-processing enzyme [compost metagenome]